MHQEGFLSFIYRHILLGLAAAFVALLVLFTFFPDFIKERGFTVIFATETSSPPLNSGPFSYSSAVKAAAPAIVNIYSSKVVTETIPYFDDPELKRFFGNPVVPRQRLERNLGSGVILSTDGYLLSNYHVVKNASEILVALQDGRTTEAVIVGHDPDTDLSVLKIELDNLPSITISQSNTLEVGDIAMAIGNPFGVGQTVTLGIVSATGRSDIGINTFENFIQTDAAINPGNSGGGLINARGELIGINTAIFSRSGGSQGIGFAIPIGIVKETMKQIIHQGYVARGWLGFTTQDLTPQLSESFAQSNLSGVLVTRVYRNSPAHQAGIIPGDVLIELDGETISNSRQTYKQITQLTLNSHITLSVQRGEELLQLTSRVIQHPEAIEP